MNLIAGIDPGKSGGVVILQTDGALWQATRAESYVRDGEYVEALMAEFLGRDRYKSFRPALIVLERQHAMPSKIVKGGKVVRLQGNTSTFSTGVGYGLWRGICGALSLPLQIVSAVTWQKAVLLGVAGDDTKARAVRAASLRIPSLNLTPGKARKPHQGLADAACLALYGLTLLAKAED